MNGKAIDTIGTKGLAEALGISKDAADRMVARPDFPAPAAAESTGQRGGRPEKRWRIPDLPKTLAIKGRTVAIRETAQQWALQQAIARPAAVPPAPTSVSSSPATTTAGALPAERPERQPGLFIRGQRRAAKPAAALTDKDRAYQEGCLILCRAVDTAMLLADCSEMRAIVELAERLVGGSARPELLDAARVTYLKPRQAKGPLGGLDAQVSRLQKMMAFYRAGLAEGAAERYLVAGRPQKTGQKHEDVVAFLRHYCKPSRPNVALAWKDAAPWYATQGLHYPAVDTWRRIEAGLPMTTKNHGRMTGAAFTALKPYIQRDVSMFKANDIWVGDGHTFKARVRHPLTGKPFRPEITMILDWVSRKIVGWSVDLAESTIAVSAAFRHGQIVTRARPLVYYSDKGAGQTGKQIDHPITGTLARQGIAHETGIPGHPQARGIIERLWASTVIPLAKTYPTVMTKDADRDHVRRTGRELDRAERAGEVSGLVPHWQDFMRDLEQVVMRYNASHGHSGIGGATPDAAYAAKLDPDSIVFGVEDAEIEALWLPEEVRRPERGLVSLFNNKYFRADLVELLAEDEDVRVRFDIHAPETVWLYRMDGAPLGAATWNGNKVAAFPVPFVERKRQERVRNQIALKQRDIARIEEERGTTFAVPTAAVQAFGGRLVSDAEAVATGARLLAEDAARAEREIAARPVDPTGAELAERWIDIQARLDAGDPVSDDDLYWRGNIHRSAKFRTEMKRRGLEFGFDPYAAAGRRAAA
jgi:putative transposase